MNEKNEIILFENQGVKLEVNLKDETVWLTQKQMAELFDKDRRTITRHIQNIYKDGELEENSVCSFFEHTANDGKTYTVQYYNLEMILSIGYRVKSKRGIMFRRWANSILKQYLLNGHVINKERCIAHSDNIIKINNTINDMNSRLSNVELRLDNLTSIDIYK